MKAKAFINRSFDARDDGNFELAALWASIALELLGKSALAKVNPLLIADPQDDGRSVLVAAGLSSDVARFKSIPAKAVFSRCARAFPPFNEKEAAGIAHSRTAELHSGSLPFAGINEDTWWDRYWAQALLLVTARSGTVEEFVGTERAAVVEQHLARNAENIAHRTLALVQSAALLYTRAASSADAQRELAVNIARLDLLLAATFHAPQTCPSCDEIGALLGDDVLDSEVEYDEDGDALERVQVYADAFECESCGLQLGRPEFVQAADLPGTFPAEREYEPEWDDYGND